MNKGETASLSGEIEVTAKSGPDSWTFDAARELNHQIGREEGDAWSVKVGDPRESYMCFGPYATELGSGPRVAVFRVMLDNVSFDDAKILTLDVTDAKAGTVLAKMDLTRHSFRAPMEYQDFALPFQCPANAKIELRTLWHGASYARESQVVVRKR